jgi:hypothetical protein
MVKRPQQQRHHGRGGYGIWTDKACRGVSRVGKQCQPVGLAIKSTRFVNKLSSELVRFRITIPGAIT